MKNIKNNLIFKYMIQIVFIIFIFILNYNQKILLNPK